MGFGAPAPPPPQPIPPIPPAASPPTLASSGSAISDAVAASRKSKAAKGAGFNNTIQTSPQGAVTGASNLAVPTLIGS